MRGVRRLNEVYVKKKTKLAIGYWGLALSAQVFASFIAYETIGWAEQASFVVVSLLVNLVVLMVCSFRFRVGLLLGLAYLAFICVDWAPLVVRWYYVDREARHIVTWAEAEKLKTGSYPVDLKEYEFLSPKYKEYIDYYKDSWTPDFRFGVSYIVGTPNTNHHYDPKGGWYYQDD